MTSKKADFRTFYRDAHAVECLTDREKMLIGLTVAMMRLCDPWVDRRLADARKAGMTEEELDAAVDVIAAVDAGVLQSLNQRIKARNKGWKIDRAAFATRRNFTSTASRPPNLNSARSKVRWL
jgi:hypothetical protein